MYHTNEMNCMVHVYFCGSRIGKWCGTAIRIVWLQSDFRYDTMCNNNRVSRVSGNEGVLIK